MKKYIFSTFIFLFSLSFAHAENIHKTIGELKTEYHKTSGLERLEVAEKMVPIMIDNSSFEEAEEILDDLSNGIATDQLFHARWLILKANSFEAQFDFSNAMNNYYKALDIFSSLDDKNRLAQTYYNIGQNFNAQSEVGKAVENLKLAKELYTEVGSNVELAKTNTALGDIYFKKEIYGKSKTFYKSSLDIHVANSNFVEAARLAENLGTIELVLEDFDAALSYFNNAREIYYAQNNSKGVAINTFNEAKVYYEDDSVEEAKEKLLEAIEMSSSLNDNLFLAQLKSFEGQLNARNDNHELATVSLLKAGDLLDNMGNNPEALIIYKNISDAFFDMSDHKNAYNYLEKYLLTKNIVFNEEKSRILFEVSKKFESKFHDKEQKQQISLLEMEKKSSVKMNYSLGFGFLALLGGLFMLFRSNKQKKRDNALLVNKNVEIEKQADKIKQKQQEVLNAKMELESLNAQLVKEMGDREAMESNTFQKDKFIANKSNAMRTPLQNVVGAAHMIVNDKSNRGEENYETLMYSVNELVVHINDVLDYSNVEAGKIVLQDKPFNFKKLVAAIEGNFSQMYRDKGVNIDFSLGSNIPDVLVGDANKLKQILHNYVEDILRNAQTGDHFNLIIKLKELLNNDITLNFDLNFEGNLQSLNSKDSTFLFELESTQNFNLEKIDIARRMIELQGGKAFENTTEKGKRIQFDLFFGIPKEGETEISKDFSFENRHILLIEDNKINQMVVKKMLERKGIRVSTADNGKEGLEVFKSFDFDLVLLDIQMPIMDGYETAAEIRKLPFPDKNKVPIIALTASAYLTEKEKANLFGMNDHVGKPFSPEELINKVHVNLESVKA